MVTSNADGCPIDQLRKYMSPGLELICGMNFFCSQTGAKFAVKQAANILSLTLSCRDIISLDHGSLKRGHPACPVCHFHRKGIFVLQCIKEHQSDSEFIWLKMKAQKGLQVRKARHQIEANLLEANELSPYLKSDYQEGQNKQHRQVPPESCVVYIA